MPETSTVAQGCIFIHTYVPVGVEREDATAITGTTTIRSTFLTNLSMQEFVCHQASQYPQAAWKDKDHNGASGTMQTMCNHIMTHLGASL